MLSLLTQEQDSIEAPHGSLVGGSELKRIYPERTIYVKTPHRCLIKDELILRPCSSDAVARKWDRRA